MANKMTEPQKTEELNEILPEPEQPADDKVVRLVFEGTEGEDFAG